MPVQIEGRNIHIINGSVSQTVNVCDENNQRGRYEWIVRLIPPHFVDGDDVQGQISIVGLIDWLKNDRSGRVERHPATFEDKTIRLGCAKPAPPEDAGWIAEAVRVTETCVGELVQEFLQTPCLYRVQHSLHARLYALLSGQPHFAGHFPLGTSGVLTQPIHKEWPETEPRPEKGNRRGNFDLAVLSPEQLRSSSTQEFTEGRLAAPIVIEVGLNYGEPHFAQDAEKLRNSSVPHGYLIHLLREMPRG